MELVQGGELFDLIEHRGELSPSLARLYFQQLVDGIEYCHRRGVFHRDLKPENLLLDSDGALKITDFGMSSMIPKQGSSLLYTAVGTPYYCAPEIVNGAPEGYRGEKVDAWSCGIILYLLLVGHLPFRNENMSELFEEINSAIITYPDWLDDDAVDLIGKLLRRNPAERISLEETKNHRWFRVNYEHVSNDGNQLFGTSSISTKISSQNQYDGAGSLGIASVESMKSLPKSVVAIAPTAKPDPKPKKPVLRKLEPEYSDKDLSVLVKDALVGKPEKKIVDVVGKLEGLEIDCSDDLIFLASALQKPDTFANWLQEKSGIQDISCMRLAAFFYE